jgi:hypothetical protein
MPQLGPTGIASGPHTGRQDASAEWGLGARPGKVVPSATQAHYPRRMGPLPLSMPVGPLPAPLRGALAEAEIPGPPPRDPGSGPNRESGNPDSPVVVFERKDGENGGIGKPPRARENGGNGLRIYSAASIMSVRLRTACGSLVVRVHWPHWPRAVASPRLPVTQPVGGSGSDASAAVRARASRGRQVPGPVPAH